MGSWKCDICEFITDSRERYAGHRSSHVRKGDIPKKPPRSTDHICKFCQRNFKSGASLGAHISRCGTTDMISEQMRLGLRGSKGSLRKTLLRLGHKFECATCGQGPTWNGLPLTLQVDHIDGNNKNNDPKNLRFLCPNCHTQTPTYGSKKRIP